MIRDLPLVVTAVIMLVGVATLIRRARRALGGDRLLVQQLAKTIDIERRAAGVSLRALAARMGTSLSQVQRFLGNGNGITLGTLIKAADALDLELEIRLTPRASIPPDPATIRQRAFDAAGGTLLSVREGWLVRVGRGEQVIERIRPLIGAAGARRVWYGYECLNGTCGTLVNVRLEGAPRLPDRVPVVRCPDCTALMHYKGADDVTDGKPG